MLVFITVIGKYIRIVKAKIQKKYLSSLSNRGQCKEKREGKRSKGVRSRGRKKISFFPSPSLPFFFLSALYREEKSLRHVSMVAKSLDLSRRKQMDMYDFPEHDCTRNKTVAHTFIPSLDNANGRLRQESQDCSDPEILLPHHTFLLCLMLLSTI